MNPAIILASTSPFRRQLLEQAGLHFEAIGASIDERAIERELAAGVATPQEIAVHLAKAKALEVAARNPDSLVIGSDQTLSLGDVVFHKPADRNEARKHLQAFSGKTHQLNSAVAIAKNSKIVWQHVESAKMTMRDLSPAFIENYLDLVGDKILASVGAYQIEAEGIQLFETISGDHFTIVGLPLLPLLAALRDLGAIDG